MLSLLLLIPFALVWASPLLVLKRQVAIEGEHVGQATWFNASLGACGQHNTDEDMIAAVTMVLFDAYPGATGNPNENPICGRKLRATYTDPDTQTTNHVTVAVTDRCASVPDCQEPFTYNVDFTPAAFQQLAPLGVGRLENMHWQFVGEGGSDSDTTDAGVTGTGGPEATAMY